MNDMELMMKMPVAPVKIVRIADVLGRRTDSETSDVLPVFSFQAQSKATVKKVLQSALMS